MWESLREGVGNLSLVVLFVGVELNSSGLLLLLQEEVTRLLVGGGGISGGWGGWSWAVQLANKACY